MPADAAPSFLWVDVLPQVGEAVTLGAEESHYLSRVCRARPGETVTLTDGRGSLARGRVTQVGAGARLEVEAVDRIQARRRAMLLCGAPEGERADWMVEKLAELGVAVLQPVDCERAAWRRSASRLDRWRRVAVAALRQSRRRFLLDVRSPIALGQAIELFAGPELRLVADPGGEPAARLLAPAGADAVGLVGPSAGLSERELTSLGVSGFRSIALSDSRLRAETAAVAWAVWWSFGA